MSEDLYITEKTFVNTYIRRERQERLLFELCSAKKRYRGLDRFCHSAEDLLDMRKVIMRGYGLSDTAEIKRYADKHTGRCVILSPDPALDKLSGTLKEALSVCALGTDAALIVGEGYAYVFTEAERGGRMQYLLERVGGENA